PDAIFYHYMDDILIASASAQILDSASKLTLQILQNHNFEISPEKIQSFAPWQYLGLKISEKTIQPVPITLNCNIKTLNNLQS
ncbi:PO113 protein, partial [Campylorhamphus procurvoides]|nr:PO113 protein [Campylorhamphus procurvoides]